MEVPEKLSSESDNNNGTSKPETTATSTKDMGSPKTPVQSTYEDSSEDSDYIESPQFPHLIPVHTRRNSNDYDLDDVRIGWDDGCGSIYQNDEDDDKNNKNVKRRKRSKLFSERRHRSFPHNFQNSSPSPVRSTIDAAEIQAELNNYLGCILNCLSAKKRNRQLKKLKNSTDPSKNEQTENNDIDQFLNDNADDDIMFTFSQTIEKKLENDVNCIAKNITKTKKNTLSIEGICPLENTDTNINNNNNNTYHIAKKFKAITSNHFSEENKLSNNINDNKDNSSSMFDDCDDDLFTAVDLAIIDQQTLSNIESTTSVSMSLNSKQIHNKQQQNKMYYNNTQFKNIPALNASTSKNDTNSVLWRRSVSSSSIVKEQQTSLKPCNSNSITSNNSNNGNALSTKRYCTSAEIEEKRNRARRLLMLKFKSKNKSCS